MDGFTEQDKTLFISAADTLHDFKILKECNNNIYKHYVESVLYPYIKKMKDYSDIHLENIEDTVLHEIVHDFRRQITDTSKPKIFYPKVSFSRFTTNTFSKIMKNNENSPFKINLNLQSYEKETDTYIMLFNELKEKNPYLKTCHWLYMC